MVQRISISLISFKLNNKEIQYMHYILKLRKLIFNEYVYKLLDSKVRWFQAWNRENKLKTMDTSNLKASS